MRYILFILSLFSFISANSQQYLFEENKGQWHEDVLFRTEIPGGYLFITASGMKYLYVHPEDIEKFYGHNHGGEEGTNLRSVTGNDKLRMHAIEVNFENASTDYLVERSSPMPTYSNYFLGDDPSEWASEVKKYEEVTVKNIYSGIHLKFYHNSGNLKYDLIVEPKADPAQIKMKYTGASDLQLKDGHLEIYTEFGQNLELQPVSFQTHNNARSAVASDYKLKGNVLSFSFPEGYNRKAPLVIDPTLIFSTYSGSLADNWGFTATFDEEGNLYSGGIVRAIGFPVTNGAFQENFAGRWDVALLKFDTTGSQLIYATYLGGTETETPHSIIVNNSNELVIFGTTSSTDFPTTQDAYQRTFLGGETMDNDPDSQLPSDNLNVPVGGVPYVNGSDMYVAVLSTDGKDLVVSSLFGGSENDGLMLRMQPLTKNYGDAFRGEVIVDEDDNIYVTTYTSSEDFPIVNGFQSSYGGGSHDGLVFKTNPELSQILWSTYLGGDDMDGLYSIKLDADDNVIVGGGTVSNNYPTTAGVHRETKSSPTDIDGVISIIANDGNGLLHSTFVGTTAYDQVYFIETDSSKNVYVLGQTQGNYPVSDNVYSNPNSGQFIHKFNSRLDSTYFSTVFGSERGSPDIRPTAFLVNECENMLISGWGGASNSRTGYLGGSTFGMPVTANAFQTTTDGSDFYLMVLFQDATQLLYASYFGESGGIGDHVDGGTSRFDKRGIIYQSVCASCRGSNNFPTTPNAWASENGSLFPERNCNNAVFKFDLSQLLAKLDTDSPEFDSPGITSGCAPFDVVFLNKSIGGIDFFWDFGNGITSTQKDSIPITYENPGIYPVSLRATDIATCVREDFDYGTIAVFDQHFEVMESQKICAGSQVGLNAEGGISYQWSPARHLNNPDLKNPIASPDTTTYFKVTMTNEHGCIEQDSVLITVVPEFTVDFSFIKENSCFDSPDILFSNQSSGAESFSWNLGDGTSSEEDSLVYNYSKSGTFTVQLTGKLDICEKTAEHTVPSVETFIPNVITPNDDGKNDYFQILTTEPVDLTVFNRWGRTLFEKENYKGEFDGKGFTEGVYYYEAIFQEDGTSCFGWLQILK